jgi:hypothetical protein
VRRRIRAGAPKSWAPPLLKECAKIRVHILGKTEVLTKSNSVFEENARVFFL